MAALTTPLWEHQCKGVQFALERPASLLNMEMGTGKTLTALAWIVARNFGRVLIVCPKKALAVWEDEIALHTEGFTIFNFDRPGNLYKRLREWQKDDSSVTLVNYDLIRRKEAEKAFLNQFDAVILDEGHRIKSHSAKQSKACHRLGRTAKHKLVLTGTPFHNSPSDIFGQARFLDEAIFGTVWYKFRDQYEVTIPLPVGRGVLKTIGYKNTPELQEKVAPIMYTVKIEDVMEMPERSNIIRRVTLPTPVQKIYRTLAKEMIAELGAGVITASNVLVKTLRLRQLAGGFLQADRSTIVEELHQEKLDALDDIIDSISQEQKFVVFAHFKAEIVAIKKLLTALNISHIEISGSRNEYADWSEVRCAVVQISSGSEAINLTPARFAVYYSLPHSLGTYQQSRARIWRPGADQAVRYYHLLADGTLDHVMYQALQKKQNINQSILEGIRNVR